MLPDAALDRRPPQEVYPCSVFPMLVCTVTRANGGITLQPALCTGCLGSATVVVRHRSNAADCCAATADASVDGGGLMLVIA